ncbi:uncharacterized protein L969DRAFT_95199 [Mixia osmundae IAM 14324]|uniref:Uncharacterized protein n=1 Tax=Mixia osmundae (strain CBS 9802 / IAM 14324 / JCM 22182 / KY 12970) TaxID=764103 RepID=G7E6V9_MIXOS|nr:uncharacterized protein L969DRAFT_95199 [Mixia osmundae IAM 14324]KEI39049.1 hypothetical protein L969DRAFT_95199 [Mixia osmundae IAM 14324]GAA98569.1 hypothetical protein E5Q_05256 [Mixia osmundae IAM 14324]
MFKSLAFAVAALAVVSSASADGPARLDDAHTLSKRMLDGQHAFSMTIPLATGVYSLSFAATVAKDAVTKVIHVGNLGHCNAEALGGNVVGGGKDEYSSVHIHTAAQPGTTYPVIDLTISIYIGTAGIRYNIASYTLDGKPMTTTEHIGYSMAVDGFPMTWTDPVAP